MHSKIDAEIITVSLNFPDGANPKDFTDAFKKIEQQITSYQYNIEQKSRYAEIANIRSQIFASGLQGKFYITLPTHYQGQYNSQRISDELNALLATPPQAKSLDINHTFNQENLSKPSQLKVNLDSTEQDELYTAIKLLQHYTNSISGVTHTNNSMSQSISNMHISLNSLAHSLNISTDDIHHALQARFTSHQIKQAKVIKVKLPEQEKKSLWHLSNTPIAIKTTDNQENSMPLSQLAELSYTYSPASSHIKNGRHTAWLSIEFDRELTHKESLKNNLESYVNNNIAINFKDVRLSLNEQQANEKMIIKNLSAGFFIALILMFICMALLFNSYSQPFYVLSAIPFGIIGSLLGHLILFEPLTIWSITGMIAVSGIVVNDNIVLVHFINEARKNGAGVSQAILAAGTDRFRPIFLTTITSFIGLLPILLEKSFEAQFLIPMAISISFGILFATAISLILVPTLYSFSHENHTN